MTAEMFRELVFAVATIVGIIFTTYLVPFIKTKISETELATLTEYVAIFVRCAQQIYTVEQWKEKKEYVMEHVREIINQKMHIELTDEDLSSIIEGAVYKLKN